MSNITYESPLLIQLDKIDIADAHTELNSTSPNNEDLSNMAKNTDAMVNLNEQLAEDRTNLPEDIPVEVIILSVLLTITALILIIVCCWLHRIRISRIFKTNTKESDEKEKEVIPTPST